jgi:tryptophan synthase alpha subunit
MPRRKPCGPSFPYICAGDPNFARTVEIALALERNGADLLELGLPFSDPLADGIVQPTGGATRARKPEATAHGVLDCVREIRRASEIPIVLYTYLNPIFRFGIEKFNQAAATLVWMVCSSSICRPEEDANAQKLDGLKPSSLRQ